MKINACKVMTKMWKIAQAKPAIRWNTNKIGSKFRHCRLTPMHRPTERSTGTPARQHTYYQTTAYRGIRFWTRTLPSSAGSWPEQATDRKVRRTTRESTAKAFDFDIVVNTDQQYANRQSQSRIQVSCRHDAQQGMMITGNALPCHRQQINRQHIHGVHQENPDK